MNKLPLKRTIRIGGRAVGPGQPTYFIAEIGSNHDGSLERAKRLIDAAAAVGADAVKFQSFTADGLYVPREKTAAGWQEYRLWKLFGQWELPASWLPELKAHSTKAGVHFMSTPFEAAALAQLDELEVPAFKIASGDMTNLPLIRQAAKIKKPLLVATGMATLDEVRATVQAAANAGARELALFHCVSLYPPRFEEMNLRAVETLAEEFGCPTGLSDHTPGWEAVVAAVALGATIIEKHITDDRKRQGPDHPYALEVAEFGAMIKAVRNVEAALGDGRKKPVERELGERKMARRGLYAARPIKKGEKVAADAVKTLRPVFGLGAERVDDVVGGRASRDIEPDEPLTPALVRSGR